MPTFPAPETGILLTHFIVSEDIARSRDFYVDVLVGWSAMRLREVQVEPSTEVGNGTLRRDNAPR